MRCSCACKPYASKSPSSPAFQIHAKQEIAAEAQDEANDKIGKAAAKQAAAKVVVAVQDSGSSATTTVLPTTPAAPVFVSKPSKTIRAADLTTKSYLETEEDVEAYVNQLRHNYWPRFSPGIRHGYSSCLCFIERLYEASVHFKLVGFMEFSWPTIQSRVVIKPILLSNVLRKRQPMACTV
jgi:hypothetical protein